MYQFNEQPIEKADKSPGDVLDVHSIFYTIQGEGPFTGHAAIFIRLAGCNLQCPGCDTDYTTGRVRRGIALILGELHNLKLSEGLTAESNPLVVITGGEPFRQNILYLVKALVRDSYPVQIETNGTLPIPEDFPKEATIVCSPKTGRIQPSVMQQAKALKYVVKAGSLLSDGLPARALDHTCSPCVARPDSTFTGTVYVQPMDERNQVANRKNTEAAKNSCIRNGHVLQLQLHKLIGVE